MNRRYLFLVCVSTLLVLVYSQAFASNNSLSLESQRTVFVVDTQANTTTTVVTFNVQSESNTFYWLFAVPKNPKTIALMPNYDVNVLDYLSEPYIIDPFSPCDLWPEYGIGDGWKTVPEQKPLVVLDYLTVQGISSLTKLQEWDYPLDNDLQSQVNTLGKQGFTFIALHLEKKHYDAGMISETDPFGIPSIVMTFDGLETALPLPIMSRFAQQPIQQLTWVLANQKYQAANYRSEPIDFSHLPPLEPHSIGGRPFSPISVLAQNYIDYRSQQVESDPTQIKPAGFAIEYAKANAELYDKNDETIDPLWKDLLKNVSFLTRFYSEWSPEFNQVIPIFKLASDNVTVPKPSERIDKGWPPNQIYLDEWVDPFKYFQCTTENLLLRETNARLPSERLYIPDLQAQIAYPSGWQLTRIHGGKYNQYSLYVFAPKTLTQYDFQTNLVGQASIPMLVLTQRQFSYFNIRLDPEMRDIFDDPYSVSLETFMAYDQPSEISLPKWISKVRYSAVPQIDEHKTAYTDGLLINFLTSQQDWQEHKALYEAMIDYAKGYQYFGNASLRHTLFLGDQSDITQIPYPDGWQESYRVGEVLIAPQAVPNPESTAHIRLHPLDWDDQTNQDYISKQYGLDTDTISKNVNRIMPFKTHDRQGYIIFRKMFYQWVPSPPGYVIEISAPEALFQSNEGLLNTIAYGIKSGKFPDTRG